MGCEGENDEAQKQSSGQMWHLLWRLQTLYVEKMRRLFIHLSNFGRSPMSVLQVRIDEGVAYMW